MVLSIKAKHHIFVFSSECLEIIKQTLVAGES